ncbi:MAG: TIGR03032 family protein [Planctomycetota bacterium]|nr:MAG: TIGR03032 family protein [Planctomycetota bacterium]
MSQASPAPVNVELIGSRQLPQWMVEQSVSLALTTYQAGKLFLIGVQPSGRLSIFERTFNRCMGLWADGAGQTLWMSSLYQLWRFENVLDPGQSFDGYDRVYVPQVGYVTGDLDIHDIAVDGDGRVVFVNTLFGCLATVSETHSFVPLWKPPFLDRLAAEDRCHLNGLAMKDGSPRWVTAVSRSNVADGWRDRRADGGVVIDVPTGELVVEGLSMPHSPRWYRGRLWLLDSGSGYFGYVDERNRRFERVAFCPGYLRGLTFVGDFAIVGLSKPRHNRTFSGLALDVELQRHGAEPRCGVHVIDLRSGDAVHWLRIEGFIEELYDVVVLPGVRMPMAIGFKTDEIRRVLRVGPEQTLNATEPADPASVGEVAEADQAVE